MALLNIYFDISFPTCRSVMKTQYRTKAVWVSILLMKEIQNGTCTNKVIPTYWVLFHNIHKSTFIFLLIHSPYWKCSSNGISMHICLSFELLHALLFRLCFKVSTESLFISTKIIKLFVRFKNLIVKYKKNPTPLCSKWINHICESRKWATVCHIIFSNMFFVEEAL